jgi:hypothetical protein
MVPPASPASRTQAAPFRIHRGAVASACHATRMKRNHPPTRWGCRPRSGCPCPRCDANRTNQHVEMMVATPPRRASQVVADRRADLGMSCRWSLTSSDASFRLKTWFAECPDGRRDTSERSRPVRQVEPRGPRSVMAACMRGRSHANADRRNRRPPTQARESNRRTACISPTLLLWSALSAPCANHTHSSPVPGQSRMADGRK